MVHKAKADLLVSRNERPSGSTDVVQYGVQDRQQIALAYAARGWSGTRIAEVVGVDEATICRWRKEPWWREGIAQAVDRIIREPVGCFTPHLPKALERLDDALDNKEQPALQLRAVTEVFDRVFGKPQTSGQSSGGVVVNIILAPNTEEGVSTHIAYDSGDVVDSEAHVIEDV